MTKWEDLESEAIYAIGAIGDGMEGVDGSMSKMIETQEATFGNRFQGMLRELKSALLPLGFVLLDLAESIMPLLTSAAKTLSEWFSGLSPIAQNFTVVAGAIGTALSPIIGIIGKLAGGISKLIPHLKNAGGMMGLLSRAALLLTGPVGVTIGILAGLGITAYQVGKAMNTASIESNVFGEEVSESTQKVVGSYLEMDKSLRTSINGLAWSQKTITEEMANDLIGKYKTMGDTITTEMKKDHEEQLLATQEMFTSSAALTEEEEAKILEKLKESQAAEQEENQKNQDRIKEILTNASNEKRALTSTERAEINNIQNQMRTDAVTVLSASAEEQKAILGALKAESGVMSAEMAAETVKQSLKARNETVENAKQEHKDRVAEIQRMRDESGVISEEQAKKLIEESKKQRDETIRNAEEMHTNVVSEAKLQAGEHVNQVDWAKGEVLSKWETMKTETIGKFKTLVTDAIGKFEEIRKGITGKVDEAKNTIKGIVETIVGFFTNMKLKLPEISLPKLPKLPKVSITGKLGLNPPSVPSFKWNAKGGFTDGPIPIGMQGNSIGMAGEAGTEAIIPLSSKYRRNMLPFSNAVANTVLKFLKGRDSTGGVNIQVDSLVVREESDIQKIARELYSLQQRKTRGS